MRLKDSIERIEQKICYGEDWDKLWDRYRDVYLNDGEPLNSHAVRPFPPCTWQDRYYEYWDWTKDIQDGGKEMELVKKRIVDPEKFEKFHSGMDQEAAMELRKASNNLTPMYAQLLNQLCDASRNDYQTFWLPESMQSHFKKEIGPVHYQILDISVRRCEQNIINKKEKTGYGPKVFGLFREAGHKGDLIVGKILANKLNA
jgi:hypothetical protein